MRAEFAGRHLPHGSLVLSMSSWRCQLSSIECAAVASLSGRQEQSSPSLSRDAAACREKISSPQPPAPPLPPPSQVPPIARSVNLGSIRFLIFENPRAAPRRPPRRLRAARQLFSTEAFRRPRSCTTCLRQPPRDLSAHNAPERVCEDQGLSRKSSYSSLLHLRPCTIPSPRACRVCKLVKVSKLPQPAKTRALCARLVAWTRALVGLAYSVALSRPHC